jgi:hypothetical protein
MSESVSAGASAGVSSGAAPSSPAASSAPSGGGSSVGQSSMGTPSSTAPSNPNPAAQGQTAPQTPAQAARELGDTDLDALVSVKINGQVQKIPLRDAIGDFQLKQRSHQKMTEAQKLQQQAQQIMQLAQSDPRQLFKMAGKDFEALAEETLAKKYELMQMDPVQRELLQAREELNAVKSREMQSKQSVIEEIKQYSDKLPQGLENHSKEDLLQYRDHLKNVHTQADQSLQNEIVQAWEESKLPKDKRWGVMIAREMLMSQKSPTGPLQAKEAAAKVKADWLSFNKDIFGQMDASAIHDLLGKDLMQKLREFDIQRVSDKQTPAWASANKTPTSNASAPKEQLNQIEWRKRMGIG